MATAATTESTKPGAEKPEQKSSPDGEKGKSLEPLTPQERAKRAEENAVEVTDEDVEKLRPPLVQTPDDAVSQYLRGLIDEQEFRKALAIYGVTTLYQPGKTERIDAAFEVKIPEDLLEAPGTPYDDFDYRKELVDAKQEERDEAIKATEGETREETVAREQRELEEKRNGGSDISRLTQAKADGVVSAQPHVKTAGKTAGTVGDP